MWNIRESNHVLYSCTLCILSREEKMWLYYFLVIVLIIDTEY